MQVDVTRYAYRVRWSAQADEWEGTVAELPQLSWRGASQVGALEGIVALARQTVEAMQEAGADVPTPLSEQFFSGSIRLRVPPEQHRELAIRAAEEGVSLNRYLCSLLSIAQGARVVAAKVDGEGNVVD